MTTLLPPALTATPRFSGLIRHRAPRAAEAAQPSPVETPAGATFDAPAALSKAEKKAAKKADKTKAPFYANKENRMVIGAGRGLVHGIEKLLRMRVTISPEDVERLRALAQSPDGVILTPNHSSIFDALTIVELSRQAQINFVAMGALEAVFEPVIMGKKRPWVGQLTRRMNVFSVDRGNKNKEKTFQRAEKILTEGKNPFVIFPGGRVTFSNLYVEELKDGAGRFGFAVVRAGKNNVQVVPLSIFYHQRKDLTKLLTAMVGDLEQELSSRGGDTVTRADRKQPLSVRVNRLFDQMVFDKQRQYTERYGLAQPLLQDGALTPLERLHVLNEANLNFLEAKYDMAPADKAQQVVAYEDVSEADQDLRAKRLVASVHQVRRAKLAEVKELKALLEDNPEALVAREMPVDDEGNDLPLTRKERLLLARDRAVAKTRHVMKEGKVELAELKADLDELNQDLDTLKDIGNLSMYPQNYLPATKAGSTRDRVMQIRVFETVAKLERDILGGKISKNGMRHVKLTRKARIDARVAVGEPIDLGAFFKANGGEHLDDKALSARLMPEVRKTLQANIDAMADGVG